MTRTVVHIALFMVALAFAAALPIAVLAGLGGCGQPAKPDQFFEAVVDCGAAECRTHCDELAGPVVACLLSQNAAVCLNGIVVPASGITRDAVACVVRRLGSEANAKQLAGDSDPQAGQIANAARAWITSEKIGYR